ncbi:MAG: NAD-binding protein [Candidatus Binatia bacterium]|nr:NAD-binding protein [Candidatus Binatia bacterium]
MFATSGAHIFHLGDLGAGAIAKLAHNLIVYVNMLAASEGMRLGEKAGLDVKTLQDVVRVSAGQSRVADNWLQQRTLKETYTAGPEALRQLIYKDLRLALELGHDLGLSLPGAALAQQLIDRVLEISP